MAGKKGGGDKKTRAHPPKKTTCWKSCMKKRSYRANRNFRLCPTGGYCKFVAKQMPSK